MQTTCQLPSCTSYAQAKGTGVCHNATSDDRFGFAYDRFNGIKRLISPLSMRRPKCQRYLKFNQVKHNPSKGQMYSNVFMMYIIFFPQSAVIMENKIMYTMYTMYSCI